MIKVVPLDTVGVPMFSMSPSDYAKEVETALNRYESVLGVFAREFGRSTHFFAIVTDTPPAKISRKTSPAT